MDEPNSKTSAKPGRRRVARALAAAILLALLCTPGLLWQKHRHDLTVEQASYASAQDRGEQVAQLLLGLNADNGATSLTKLRGLAAGDFADQVDALDKLVASLLQQGKVASRGKVLATAVEELDAGTATVLVASAAVVTNAELPQGELRTFRMAVHLRHTPSGWKADNVEFLS